MSTSRTSSSNALLLPFLMLANRGRASAQAISSVTYRFAVMWSALSLAARPWVWSRAVWDVFARQLLFTGVDSLGVALRIAVAVGVMVIVQGALWLGTIGQMELMGPILLKLVVRELAPLLANLVVVLRSGTAITTELANMKLAGEVDLLDSQGLDPMIYLVMPRVLALPISVFCLTIVFIFVSFVSGYSVGVLLGEIHQPPDIFFGEIFRVATAEEVMFVLPKTVLTGLIIGVVCSVEGLSVRRAATEVPQAASRSAIGSFSAIFAVSALLSLLIYGTVLLIEID